MTKEKGSGEHVLRAGCRAAALLAKRIVAGVLCLLCALPALAQDVLRGHGGPVRALALNGPARELVSGSFDSTVIVWDITRNSAKRVLRFHDGPVNAVALLENGCFATGGEDKRVAIWCGEDTKPRHVLIGHETPVTAIASMRNEVVAGSIDGRLRVWSGADLRPADALEFHKGAVHAAAAIVDSAGKPAGLVTGGADNALRLMAPHVDDRIQLDAPITAIAVAADGMVAAGADGKIRLIGRGRSVTEIEVEGIPLSSLALSPDGKLIATAGLRGGIAIIDRGSRKIIHRLTGPGLPVWSMVFDTDNRTLFTGGADRVIRRWDAVEGKAITSALPERDAVAEAAASGERGAVVFRACQACHTLSPDGGNRAGPSLHGVFGRRIGTAPGYLYSEALPRMSIVWNRETIARLFEIGPNAYTPGTKMPEQTINNAEDRHALVEWLERVTR